MFQPSVETFYEPSISIIALQLLTQSTTSFPSSTYFFLFPFVWGATEDSMDVSIDLVVPVLWFKNCTESKGRGGRYWSSAHYKLSKCELERRGIEKKKGSKLIWNEWERKQRIIVNKDIAGFWNWPTRGPSSPFYSQYLESICSQNWRLWVYCHLIPI